MRDDIISEVFQKFNNSKKKLTFWQQLSSTERYRFEGQIYNIKQDKIYVKITSLSPEELTLIDKDKPIFAFASRENIIFKKERYLLSLDQLEFTLPHDLQISEKRTLERFYYKYQDHKSLTFTTSEHGNTVYNAVIVDISVRGMGFVVNNRSELPLRTGSTIFLKNVTDQKMPDPFPAKVIYIEPYAAKEKEDLLKVGVIFDVDLDSISYKSITSVIQKKQQQVKGLRPDRYCGITLEEQAKILKNIAVSNKALAVNLRKSIDYLDKIRYLTTKMKIEFLMEIDLPLLATALRLSSKELIFELFYETSKSIQDEFLDYLGLEKPASAINKAQDEIIALIKEKEQTGEYNLDPLAYITYV